MKHELSDIDPQKMDSQKWDMLLNLLEHPEKYSETQKDELLGDEEVNELYQQLVETRQSLDFAKSKEKMKMPSIDAEWEKLKYEMTLKEKLQKDETKQNAETQPTAKQLPLWSPMRKVAAVAAVLVASGITFAEPISICRYTCMESAEMIDPLIFFASSMDKAVFPTAVGPVKMTIGLFSVIIFIRFS